MMRSLLTLVTLGICIAMLAASGCVSAGKQVVTEILATPIPTQTENLTSENFFPIPTPEPTVSPPVVYVDPHKKLYDAKKRELGQFFEFSRDNVSGLKDLHIRITVYRYKILENYHWYSNEWGRYFLQFPPTGYRYLVICPYIELVGETQEEDPRYYVDDEPWSRFTLDYAGKLIEPDQEYEKAHRIQELEETFTLNNDDRVKPFGYYWHNFGYQSGEKHGIMAISPEWLRMGKSNAWDGYILYLIPDDAKLEDIRVVSDWGAFGDVFWELT